MVEIPVRLGQRSYRILVGAGLLADTGTELARLKAGRKGALVTDPSILALPGETVSRRLADAGFDVTRGVVAWGETAQTLDGAVSAEARGGQRRVGAVC